MEKSNVEIIQELLEQIVNKKKIAKWDHYFSQDYVAHGAPTIGFGFSRDTSGNQHLVQGVFPNSPADGKLQVGDLVVWVEDEGRRWETYQEIQQAFSQDFQCRKIKLGLRRGDQSLEVEMAKDYFKGFDTHTEQAKSEMHAFMTKDFPDLKVSIQLIVVDGEMVVSLLEYRGTHARFKREVVWREAWFTRLAEGQVIESWPIIDESSFLRQLGYQLVPPNAKQN